MGEVLGMMGWENWRRRGQCWVVLQPSQLFLLPPTLCWPLLRQESSFSRCDHGVSSHNVWFWEFISWNFDLSEIFIVCSSGWRTRTDPWAARSKLGNGHFAQRDPETGRAEKTSQTANETARFKSRPCSSGISFHSATSEWQSHLWKFDYLGVI